MTKQNQAVLLLRSKVGPTDAALKSFVGAISSKFHVEKISGVYKTNQDGNHLVSMLLHVKTSLEEFNVSLLDIAERKDRKIEFRILLFGEQLCSVPQLTVPSPELMESVAVLSMANEVGHDMVHPIMDQSISQLLEKQAADQWGEFVSRGKSLLPHTK